MWCKLINNRYHNFDSKGKKKASMSRKVTNSREKVSSSSSSYPLVMDPYIYQLLKKLKRKNIRYQTIIKRCGELDRNEDYVIHISDLEDVLIDYLGIDNISRREIDHLGRLLVSHRTSHSDGLIDYRLLEEMLDKADNTISEDNENNNNNNNPVTRTSRRYEERDEEFWYSPDEAIQYQRGSVGELLYSHSCPSERKNFRKLILCLEEFERMSGMKATPTDTGFVIPLGPDLKASINFSMR